MRTLTLVSTPLYIRPERRATYGLSGVSEQTDREAQLPGSFHKVQLMYPAACALHLLHFAAQNDGIACHEA